MEPSPSAKNTIENSITMNKMKLLKEKMESMNLDRKPKRAPKVQPRPPNTHPASGSGGVTPRPPLLPALTPLSSGTSGHLWLGSSQPQGTQHSMGNLATEDLHDPVLSILPHKEHKPKAVLCPVEAEGNVVRTGGGAGTQGTRRTSASSLSSSPASSGAAVHSSGNHGAPGKPHRQPRAWNSKADPEPAIPSPSCGCRGVKVRFQGKRPEIFSRVEAMTDKASKEPLGHVSNSGLVASLARSSSRAGVKSAHGQSQLHPLGPTQRPPHPHLQLETPGGSAWTQPAVPFPSALGLGMNRNIAAAGKRGGECTHHLPPVKAPLQTKKKTRKHCFLCGKKTGLATTYECRCGNNFCSSHRYAETHGCTYDYKSAGRRFLQEANPVVKAPKLPKI